MAEKGGQPADTDVLAHLQLGDLVELLLGNITVVGAKDAALGFGNTSSAEAVVAPKGLVAGNGNTGDVGAVVDGSEAGEGTPTATDIEHGLALLQLDLLADNGHLVVLHLLERLLAGGV